MVNYGKYGYCNPPIEGLMVNQQHLQASARRNDTAAKALQTLCRSLATGIATAWRKDVFDSHYTIDIYIDIYQYISLYIILYHYVSLYVIAYNSISLYTMIIYHTGSQKGMIGMILIYVGFCFQCSTLEMIMDA